MWVATVYWKCLRGLEDGLVAFAYGGVPDALSEHRKIVYCSRTMSEIEKALIELHKLMDLGPTSWERWKIFVGWG